MMNYGSFGAMNYINFEEINDIRDLCEDIWNNLDRSGLPGIVENKVYDTCCNLAISRYMKDKGLD